MCISVGYMPISVRYMPMSGFAGPWQICLVLIHNAKGFSVLGKSIYLSISSFLKYPVASQSFNTWQLLPFYFSSYVSYIVVYLTVVLICIFLVTNEFKHPFICLSDTGISSSMKHQFKSFAHFPFWWFVFFSLICKSSLHILARGHLLHICIFLKYLLFFWLFI